MPLYKRPEMEDDELENDNTNTNPVLDQEEASFKKRYGDLRRYSQAQIKEREDKIKELEQQLNTRTAPQLPKTKEDIEAWAQKYPDVFGLIKSMIQMDLSEHDQSVQQRLSRLQEDEHKNKVRAAEIELERIHPDFFNEIRVDPAFREWLASKSQRTQDALYKNDTDAAAAAEVITMFKLETGYGKRKPGRPASDAAREVPASSRTNPGTRGEATFKESQISRMSAEEYERLEEEISRAHREGRIEMDVTGGAR